MDLVEFLVRCEEQSPGSVKILNEEQLDDLKGDDVDVEQRTEDRC